LHASVARPARAVLRLRPRPREPLLLPAVEILRGELRTPVVGASDRRDRAYDGQHEDVASGLSRTAPSYGAVHDQLAASFRSPVPLYFAYCGYAHSGRDSP